MTATLTPTAADWERSISKITSSSHALNDSTIIAAFDELRDHLWYGGDIPLTPAAWVVALRYCWLRCGQHAVQTRLAAALKEWTDAASEYRCEWSLAITEGGLVPLICARLSTSVTKGTLDMLEHLLNTIHNIIGACSDGQSDERKRALLACSAVSSDLVVIDGIVAHPASVESTRMAACRLVTSLVVISSRLDLPPFDDVVASVFSVTLYRSKALLGSNDAGSELLGMIELVAKEKPTTLVDAQPGGLGRQLVGLIASGNTNLQWWALRILGELCSDSDHTMTDFVLDSGFLPVAKTLLDDKLSDEVLVELLWHLSNIAAGRIDQAEELLDNGIVTQLLKISVGKASGPVVKELTWVVSNLVHRATDALRKDKQLWNNVKARMYRYLCYVCKNHYHSARDNAITALARMIDEDDDGGRYMRSEAPAASVNAGHDDEEDDEDDEDMSDGE